LQGDCPKGGRPTRRNGTRWSSVTAKSVAKCLKQHVDEMVRHGDRTLVLRPRTDKYDSLISPRTAAASRRFSRPQFDQVQALLATDTMNVIGVSWTRFDIAAPTAHKMPAAKSWGGEEAGGLKVTGLDWEDQSLREMAERIDKELSVTQRLLNIAKLHQRTTWPGERAAAAEAFARIARATRWEGSSPEEFLRGARRPDPKPKPVEQPEPSGPAQPRRDWTTEQHQDTREGTKTRSKPQQTSRNRSKGIGVGVAAFFVLAAIAAGAVLRQMPEHNQPPAAQTPSSGPQVSAVPSDDIASLTRKEMNVVAVEQRADAPSQTVTPVASEVTPPASPAPLTLEHQAEFLIYYLTAVESRGNVDKLSHYYSDTVNYYGKPTAKSGVVADKIKFMRRWPNRKYTIRPESLTIDCDIMRCTADGVIDFDVSNAGKRSTGTASFTYHLITRLNNSGPPLLVTAENSIVARRTVTDVSQQPAQTEWTPWPADRLRGQ
jgi:hypothetical protein